MINSEKIAAKRLKRKRKVENKKTTERQLRQSGKIIMFGNGNRILRADKPKIRKEKIIKPLLPYRAVKLTAKLDKLTKEIHDMEGSDSRLYPLKIKKDIIKNRLNQK